MKTIVFACLIAFSMAAPQRDSFGDEQVPILKDDRVHFDNGAYSFDVETGDGIAISQAGQSSGPSGAVNKAGDVSFPLPNGEQFVLKYVADEFGYKPESPFLPVAPAFPHPIPQFVLDQIAFGEQQRANRPLDAARGDYVGYDQYS